MRIEEVWGLKNTGDSIRVVRKCPVGFDHILGWLETEKESEGKDDKKI